MPNAVVSKQFAGDKTFLAAWRAAHRVTAKSGVARVVAAIPASTAVPVAAPATAASEEVAKPEVQAAA